MWPQRRPSSLSSVSRPGRPAAGNARDRDFGTGLGRPKPRWSDPKLERGDDEFEFVPQRSSPSRGVERATAVSEKAREHCHPLAIDGRGRPKQLYDLCEVRASRAKLVTTWLDRGRTTVWTPGGTSIYLLDPRGEFVAAAAADESRRAIRQDARLARIGPVRNGDIQPRTKQSGPHSRQKPESKSSVARQRRCVIPVNDETAHLKPRGVRRLACH